MNPYLEILSKFSATVGITESTKTIPITFDTTGFGEMYTKIVYRIRIKA